jgi:phenylacetate-CoA ligase
MKDLGDTYHDDPIGYLQSIPILTKKIIQDNFSKLQSTDLAQRKWFYMTPSGSTGEPIRIIQDYEFSAKVAAIQLFFSQSVGRETGEPEIYLWGSKREIIQGREKWKVKFANKLTNSIFFNA